MAGFRTPRALAAASLPAMAAAVSAESESKAVNAGISVMLLGSVGFMMGLFYLVNQKDKEMRKYSWMVISSTISIFSAVLLFQAVNGLVESLFLEGASESFELFVSVVHFLLWFMVLQAALAYLSGCLPGIRQNLEEDRRVLNLKTGGILLGHITGFAAINCFAVLQSQVPRSTVTTLAVFPLAWMIIYLLGSVTQFIRESVALAGDGRKDEAEEAWDEETAETEDDVVGLASSWCVVQSLRFAISGTLPNPEGEEPEDILSSHTDLQVFVLMSFGILFSVVELMRIMYIPYNHEKLTPQMKNIVAMSLAWCLFFSSDWFIVGHFFLSEQGMMKEIVLALFVTAVALALIFLLDYIADLDSTRHEVDTAVRSVIKAISILIGFSWEKAFDAAVESTAETLTMFPPHVTKLFLAVLLAATVIPAWRMHILPTILEYEEEEEAEAAEEGRPVGEGGSLESPLLGNEAASPRLSKDASFVGLSAKALKERCADYKQQVEELERRNRALQKQAEECHGPAAAQPAAATPPAPEPGPQLAKRNQELEERNRELEATLGGISQDLAELQKLADILKN